MKQNFKTVSALIVLLLLAISTSWSKDDAYTIEDVQGAWWSSCEEPAAEFSISGTEYGGDFLGTHPVQVANGVLIFKQGLVEGDSVEVSGTPLNFRILQADDDNLVLEAVNKDVAPRTWKLVACH
jgi:hypothetical protein